MTHIKLVNGMPVELTQAEVDEIAVEEAAWLADKGKRAARKVRLQRNRLLADTDWMAVQDRTMSQAEKDYRQALRDIPQQAGFPENVVWPTRPE